MLISALRAKTFSPANTASATLWNAVVVGRDGHVLTVAIPQPNASAVDAISQATGLAVYPVFSNATDLEATRRRLSNV